jgi:hypothetical protein
MTSLSATGERTLDLETPYRPEEVAADKAALVQAALQALQSLVPVDRSLPADVGPALPKRVVP